MQRGPIGLGKATVALIVAATLTTVIMSTLLPASAVDLAVTLVGSFWGVSTSSNWTDNL